jgi:hypothetical protein
MRCKELERRNKVLQQRYDNLHHQLTQERKVLQEVTSIMKLDMDEMKKTTSELESVVISLLQGSENKEIQGKLETAESVGIKSQSEVELLRVLCGLWKKKYYELKNDKISEQGIDDCRKKISDQDQVMRVQQESVPSVIRPSRKDAHQSVQAMIRRRGKSVKKMPSLKNMVRGKSLPPKRMKDRDRGKSLPPRRTKETRYCRTPSNDTESTAVCSADLSSCSSDSSENSNPSPTFSRCITSSMPWKSHDFHSDGLYFGQINVGSRLPDGLGVFHYRSSTNAKCYVRGEWKMGELTRRESYRDCDPSSDEDDSNKSAESEKLRNSVLKMFGGSSISTQLGCETWDHEVSVTVL